MELSLVLILLKLTLFLPTQYNNSSTQSNPSNLIHLLSRSNLEKMLLNYIRASPSPYRLSLLHKIPLAFKSTTTSSIQSSKQSLPKLFLLEYHYVDNMLERRIPIRNAHLDYANTMVKNGLLRAGGACLPDVKTGILLFESLNQEEVERFALNDPYVIHGLVTHYTIREWSVVVGKV